MSQVCELQVARSGPSYFEKNMASLNYQSMYFLNLADNECVRIMKDAREKPTYAGVKSLGKTVKYLGQIKMDNVMMDNVGVAPSDTVYVEKANPKVATRVVFSDADAGKWCSCCGKDSTYSPGFPVEYVESMLKSNFFYRQTKSPVFVGAEDVLTIPFFTKSVNLKVEAFAPNNDVVKIGKNTVLQMV